MCGLAGIWRFRGDRPEVPLEAIADSMAATLDHRGPDANGTWSDARAGIALSHRRLSIIDLSSAGAQPMVSADGRYIIVYNGEIYNSGELRPELEAKGTRFRGHSDTEVLLEACATWGLEHALSRFAGMFAFALYDREDRHLHLVRDRLGIKPLYYSVQNGTLYFSSQISGFTAAPGFSTRLNVHAVAEFLQHGYVPSPHSILSGVFKLPPGHRLHVASDGTLNSLCWWSLEHAAKSSDRLGSDGETLTDQLDHLLEKVVSQHLVSDVPLGAFLSGGIDSSIVVSMMQRISNRQVDTFTIGFSELDYDEAQAARGVATHLGTRHTELVVGPGDVQAVIPDLPTIFDEPFGDASQIPTYLVSKLAKRSVKVALSGDGGDEGFGGYTRHVALAQLMRAVGWAPPALRHLLGGGLARIPPGLWDRAACLLPAAVAPRRFGEKVHKTADLIGEPDVGAMYQRVTAQWPDPASLVGCAASAPSWLAPGSAESFPDTVTALRYWDLSRYLPDDILTKVDRSSMAVSLEARVPLLDHRLVEFAFALPTNTLIERGRGKQPLRRVLARHVPVRLTERPKSGFSIPIGNWLRGPLRAWAEDLLSEPSLRKGGLLRPNPVRRRWVRHLEEREEAPHAMWSVLMLQAWMQHWKITA